MIDADPQARQRTVKVKVAAEYQPVLPPPPAGSPFTPVEFTGLMVTPYVNDANRLAYSLKATGVRAPSRGHRPPGCRDQGRGVMAPANPAAHLCLRVGARHEVAFVPFPRRAPMFVIGAGSTLVSLTLPEQLGRRACRVRPAARQPGVGVRGGGGTPVPGPAAAAGHAGPVHADRRGRGAARCGPERADLVPLPGGQEVTA